MVIQAVFSGNTHFRILTMPCAFEGALHYLSQIAVVSRVRYFNLMPTTKELRDDIRITLSFARRSYHCWISLNELQQDENCVNLMNHYGGFFSSTICAHHDCFVLAFCTLYDKDTPDRITLERLLAQIKNQGACPQGSFAKNLQQIEDELKTIGPRVRQLYSLRSAFTAHRLKEVLLTKPHQEAAFTNSELGRLLQETAQIFNGLSYYVDGTENIDECDFEDILPPRDELKRLLSDLQVAAHNARDYPVNLG